MHIDSFNFEWDQLLVAAERRSPLCLHRRSIFQENHFPKTIYTIHHKFCAKMINSAAPKWGMEATTTNSFRQNTKKKQQYLLSTLPVLYLKLITRYERKGEGMSRQIIKKIVSELSLKLT